MGVPSEKLENALFGAWYDLQRAVELEAEQANDERRAKVREAFRLIDSLLPEGEED